MLRKKSFRLLAVLVILMLGAGACTGQPKPLPQPGTEAPGEEQSLAAVVDMDELIALVLRQEKVADAVGVITDIFSTQKASTIALIGVIMTPETTPEETPALLDEIRRQIKAADQSITTTVVTTDATLVTAIRRIADGINDDQPVNEIINDLFVVVRSLVPRDLPKNQPSVQPNAVTEVNPNKER
ncbi:MAG: YhcN/YlaJ family sporulation lipoprotein [bacterium]|jgi:hypothetical protein